MANWHERNCRRPDVVVIDMMLACKSCGSFYNCEDKDGMADRGELQKGVSEFGEAPAYLDLDWPPTVEFSSPDEVEDVSIKDTLKRLAEILHKQGDEQQDRKPRGTISSIGSTSSTFSADNALAHERKTVNEPSDRETSSAYNSLIGIDEIRLLRLSPRKSADDPILHGYLERTSLAARPEFIALSYTWADSNGDRSLTEDIFLGDLWIPLPITKNCAAALHKLRSMDHSQTFWIDSICINQLSTDEKSHQVGLMRDIFSRATCVMIFLGGDKDAADARLLKRTSESLFHNENKEKILWDAARDETGVQALFKRPYWTRIWVIQEILLSRKAVVILGETAIPLQLLLKARLVETDGRRRDLSIPSWLHLAKSLPVEDFHGLSTLLTETATCNATDPKDMVFALLGLIQGAHLGGLVADYSKSIHEIRIGIAAYFLIRQGQINILRTASFSTQQNGGLIPGSPSWVPSWTSSWASDSQSKFKPAEFMDSWCRADLRRSSLVRNQQDMMSCYDTLRPKSPINTPIGYSRRSSSPFRVLNGTGALLIKAYPMLCIEAAPFRGAFRYHSLENTSALLTPSVSVIKWGLYAKREFLDSDVGFGRPGDWVVEVPGFDEFRLLSEIPSLPGAYRISSVCGLAIVANPVDVWLLEHQMPAQLESNARCLPRHSDDVLISRLVIFDKHQLQFLRSWEILVETSSPLGPLPGKSKTTAAELSASLSANDMSQYVEWTNRINTDPWKVKQPRRPTAPEDSIKKVAEYLDRWQDLELWDRIVSSLEAVPCPNVLDALAEVRSGFCSGHRPGDQAFEITRDPSLPPAGMIKAMTTKLEDLLLQLTSCGAPLQPISMMDALRPLLQVLGEADTTTILEIFGAKKDEIETSITELESDLKFMRDSLPKCHAIRDQFSQRQLLKDLYKRTEPRDFLIH